MEEAVGIEQCAEATESDLRPQANEQVKRISADNAKTLDEQNSRMQRSVRTMVFILK